MDIRGASDYYEEGVLQKVRSAKAGQKEVVTESRDNTGGAFPPTREPRGVVLKERPEVAVQSGKHKEKDSVELRNKARRHEKECRPQEEPESRSEGRHDFEESTPSGESGDFSPRDEPSAGESQHQDSQGPLGEGEVNVEKPATEDSVEENQCRVDRRKSPPHLGTKGIGISNIDYKGEDTTERLDSPITVGVKAGQGIPQEGTVNREDCDSGDLEVEELGRHSMSTDGVQRQVSLDHRSKGIPDVLDDQQDPDQPGQAFNKDPVPPLGNRSQGIAEPNVLDDHAENQYPDQPGQTSNKVPTRSLEDRMQVIPESNVSDDHADDQQALGQSGQASNTVPARSLEDRRRVMPKFNVSDDHAEPQQARDQPGQASKALEDRRRVMPKFNVLDDHAEPRQDTDQPGQASNKVPARSLEDRSQWIPESNVLYDQKPRDQPGQSSNKVPERSLEDRRRVMPKSNVLDDHADDQQTLHQPGQASSKVTVETQDILGHEQMIPREENAGKQKDELEYGTSKIAASQDSPVAMPRRKRSVAKDAGASKGCVHEGKVDGEEMSKGASCFIGKGKEDNVPGGDNVGPDSVFTSGPQWQMDEDDMGHVLQNVADANDPKVRLLIREYTEMFNVSIVCVEIEKAGDFLRFCAAATANKHRISQRIGELIMELVIVCENMSQMIVVLDKCAKDILETLRTAFLYILDGFYDFAKPDLDSIPEIIQTMKRTGLKAETQVRNTVVHIGEVETLARKQSRGDPNKEKLYRLTSLALRSANAAIDNVCRFISGCEEAVDLWYAECKQMTDPREDCGPYGRPGTINLDQAAEYLCRWRALQCCCQNLPDRLKSVKVRLNSFTKELAEMSPENAMKLAWTLAKSLGLDTRDERKTVKKETSLEKPDEVFQLAYSQECKEPRSLEYVLVDVNKGSVSFEHLKEDQKNAESPVAPPRNRHFIQQQKSVERRYKSKCADPNRHRNSKACVLI